MLGHLGRKLADEAGRVIDFALRHWNTFGWKALDAAGVKSHPPEEPNIGFLLKYHATAVNMMISEMQSAAKEKTSDETLAKKEAQTPEAKKAAEAPITKLRLTAEQLALMFDFDAYESFVDTVTQKYGDWKPATPEDKDAVPCEIDFELAG